MAIEKDQIDRTENRAAVPAVAFLRLFPVTVMACLLAIALPYPVTAAEETPAVAAEDDAEAEPAEEKEEGKKDEKEKSPYRWRDLFNGKELGKWKPADFGIQGNIEVKDGAIIMRYSDPMSGIKWTGDFPKINYEFEYEAQRLEGIDFFATATFPVKDEFCSFVTGGWGGTIVGLSSVNFYDASDNETTRFFEFKDEKWYKIRVRVSEAKIEVWIDKEKVVDLVLEGKRLSTRFEVEPCKPFGFSTWMTTGAIRSIRVRKLTPEEVKDAALAAEKRPY